MFKSHFLALTLAALAIGAPLNPLKVRSRTLLPQLRRLTLHQRQIIPTDEELCIPNCYPHQGPHKPGGVFIPKRSASDTQVSLPYPNPFPIPKKDLLFPPTKSRVDRSSLAQTKLFNEKVHLLTLSSLSRHRS